MKNTNTKWTQRSRWALGLVLGSLIFALASAALAWTATARKKPVDRPFTMTARTVMVIDSTDWTAVGGTEGEVSSLGNFVVHATGTFDPVSGVFKGKGFAKTAHGLIFFSMTNSTWVEFQGGTDAFENITGGHTIVPTEQPQVRLVAGKYISTYRYTGEGTMTY